MIRTHDPSILATEDSFALDLEATVIDGFLVIGYQQMAEYS
jgi:hypothetical protein